MLNPDRYFDPAPGVRERRPRALRGAARPAARLSARPRRSAHARREHAVPGAGRAARHSRITTSPGCSTRRACRWRRWACPRCDGTPVETDPRAIWQTLRRALLSVPRHADAAAGSSTSWPSVFGIDERLTAATRDAHLRPHRRAAAHARVPAARAVRAVQHRGALPRPTRPTDTLEHHQRDPRLGLERPRPADVPARPRDQHPASPTGRAEIDALGGADRARTSPTTRTLHRRARERGARSSSEHGRDGHRPRGRDAVHRRAWPTTTRRRSSTARCAGEATPDDARAFTRPHADGDGADERRGRAGDAAPSGLAAQSQPRWCSSGSAPTRRRHPAGDRVHAQPAAAARTPTATIRGFTLVLFTLDETTYSRELAPLAGHYPALRLGPPWWFHDSIEGMTRFREHVDRDGRDLQHRRLQRRHARVPVDPGAARPVPPRRRQLPGRPRRPPRHRARGGAGADRRSELRPGQDHLPAAMTMAPLALMLALMAGQIPTPIKLVEARRVFLAGEAIERAVLVELGQQINEWDDSASKPMRRRPTWSSSYAIGFGIGWRRRGGGGGRRRWWWWWWWWWWGGGGGGAGGGRRRRGVITIREPSRTTPLYSDTQSGSYAAGASVAARRRLKAVVEGTEMPRP